MVAARVATRPHGRLVRAVAPLALTALGLSVAVVLLRPDVPEAPPATAVHISPGTLARVRMHVQALGDSTFLESVRVSASVVDFDTRAERFGTPSGCGVRVMVEEGWAPGRRQDIEMQAGFFGAVERDTSCTRAANKSKAESEGPIPAAARAAHYLYPFDTLTLWLRAETRIFPLGSNAVTEATDAIATPEVIIDLPEWQSVVEELPGSRRISSVRSPDGAIYQQRVPEAGVVRVRLRRPPAVQVSVVLFLVVLVLAVVLARRVDTLSDSLQVGMALAVIIWTSRTVLVRGDSRQFLAIDVVFLGLAFLVVWTVLAASWRFSDGSGASTEKST